MRRAILPELHCSPGCKGRKEGGKAEVLQTRLVRHPRPVSVMSQSICAVHNSVNQQRGR